MFSGFQEETVSFFLDLKFHNNPDFFHREHERYITDVQRPFYALIDELAPTMLKIDPGMEVRPHKCLSRIHRDTRFSKDKSPYRDHLWFLFRRTAEPRDKSLFFFFEFGPDRLDWGMGIWGENRELMDQFRRKLTANPAGLTALIDDMELDKHALFLGGSSFKRLPIPSELPPRMKSWYTAKDFYIGKRINDSGIAFTDRLARTVKKDFLVLSPIYQVFRGILDQ